MLHKRNEYYPWFMGLSYKYITRCIRNKLSVHLLPNFCLMKLLFNFDFIMNLIRFLLNFGSEQVPGKNKSKHNLIVILK